MTWAAGVASVIVAPLAGAWIETPIPDLSGRTDTVAPLAGAWIETNILTKPEKPKSGRTPRGCVD